MKDLNDPTNRDTVPAMLTPGEFVLNKEATQMFRPQLEKMNKAGLQQRQMENNMVQKNTGGPLAVQYLGDGTPPELYLDMSQEEFMLAFNALSPQEQKDFLMSARHDFGRWDTPAWAKKFITNKYYQTGLINSVPKGSAFFNQLVQSRQADNADVADYFNPYAIHDRNQTFELQHRAGMLANAKAEARRAEEEARRARFSAGEDAAMAAPGVPTGWTPPVEGVPSIGLSGGYTPPWADNNLTVAGERMVGDEDLAMSQGWTNPKRMTPEEYAMRNQLLREDAAMAAPGVPTGWTPPMRGTIPPPSDSPYASRLRVANEDLAMSQGWNNAPSTSPEVYARNARIAEEDAAMAASGVPTGWTPPPAGTIPPPSDSPYASRLRVANEDLAMSQGWTNAPPTSPEVYARNVRIAGEDAAMAAPGVPTGWTPPPAGTTLPSSDSPYASRLRIADEDLAMAQAEGVPTGWTPPAVPVIDGIIQPGDEIVDSVSMADRYMKVPKKSAYTGKLSNKPTVGYDQFGMGFDEDGNPTLAVENINSWYESMKSPGHFHKDERYKTGG